MINQEDLYTSIQDSKLIAPVMERVGIKADAWQSGDCLSENPSHQIIYDGIDPVPLFRLDKIMLALPELRIDLGEEYNGVLEDKGFLKLDINTAPLYFTGIDQRIENLLLVLLSSRGKEALKAGCVLLRLLEDNGLGREEV